MASPFDGPRLSRRQLLDVAGGAALAVDSPATAASRGDPRAPAWSKRPRRPQPPGPTSVPSSTSCSS